MRRARLRGGVSIRSVLFGIWLAAAPAVLGGCATQLPRVAEMTDAEGIETLRREFEAGNFDRSVLIGQAFLAAHPGSKHLDEGLYILARANYEEGNFLDSEDYYRRLLRDFPQSEYSEESSYYLGLAILSQSRGPGLDQSETHAAHVQLRSFLNQYPDSEYAERARHHIRSIREKLAHKQYDNAMVYYRAGDRASYAARFYFRTRVYEAYPDTPWAAEAVIKLAELHREREAWEEVAEWAGRYLADYPEGEDRDDARELLDEARGRLGDLQPPAGEPPGAGEPGTHDPGEAPPGSGGRRR